MVLYELACEAGLQPKWVASTEGGEFHSPCPKCGGIDRFSIQPNKQMKNCLGRYYCRQCHINGDAIQFAREFLGMSFQEAVDRTGALVDNSKNIFRSISYQSRSLRPISIVKPSELWQNQANNFAKWAHNNIFKNDEALQWLCTRGLPKKAVQQYQLGWCPNDIWLEKSAWGLKSNDSKKLWIPRGIVIPTFDKKGNVIRLKVRRDKYKKGDEFGKYIIVSGSMKGLNLIGDTRHKIMLATEAELDAYAVDYAVGDIVRAVAAGNNINRPDEATNYHAVNAKQLLISHDNDEAGATMLKRWQSWYPHAEPFPAPSGKDIGEGIASGLDVRRWILMSGWIDSADKSLIEWVLNYINERPVTRESYVCFEQEIALGSNSPRALTGDLQKGFRMMQKLTKDTYS